MNPVQLHKPDGTPTDYWLCECGKAWGLQEAAARCCEPKVCQCGQPCEDEVWMTCRACRDEARRQRLRDAKEVPIESTRMLYSDDLDRYFWDAGGLLEAYEDAGLDPPEWAFACRPSQIDIDADDIMEQAEEAIGWDEYEMGRAPWQGTHEFRKACQEFEVANVERVVTYHPDYKHKVRIAEVEEGQVSDE